MEPKLKDQYMEMSGANKFLAEHCGKTLSEQAKLLRGASHSVNRCNADYATCWEAVQALQARCDELEKDACQTDAAIGQLQQQVTSLEEAMEKARAAYGKLKNGS